MSSLKLDNIKVNDESAKALASCLSCLESLSLSGCKLSIAGMTEVTTSVSQLQNPVGLHIVLSLVFT